MANPTSETVTDALVRIVRICTGSESGNWPQVQEIALGALSREFGIPVKEVKRGITQDRLASVKAAHAQRDLLTSEAT